MNFLLDNFSDGLWHVDNIVELLLEFLLIIFLVVLKHALVSMFKHSGFGSFLELFCCFLHIIEFLIYYPVHLLE